MDRNGRNQQGRNPWQLVLHVWLYTDLPQALKGEPFRSVFSTDWTLISVSAAPHCGEAVAQMIYDTFRFNKVLNVHCDLDLENSKPIFLHDTDS